VLAIAGMLDGASTRDLAILRQAAEIIARHLV
jgi:hypothetical protein